MRMRTKQVALPVLATLAAATSVALASPSSAAPSNVVGVNAGGGNVQGGLGVWAQDAGFVGGYPTSTKTTVLGTTEAARFQSTRDGMSAYRVPVSAPGGYAVTLDFVETYHDAAARRVFTVKVEGEELVRNLDIYALAGKNKALSLSIEVPVTDGAVDVTFAATADVPTVAGISVTPAGQSAAAVPVTRPVVRATDDSCPAGVVTGGGFSDLAGNAHRDAVNCIVWWKVANGTTPTQYSAADQVSRAQMATFIANLMRQSGKELPASPTDYFADDNGSGHEDNINRLRHAGIISGRGDGTYGPSAAVNRDAMAKFLVAALEHRTDRPVTAKADYFADDNGSTHESNINKAATLGVTGGGADGGYRPTAPVRRDQMASFIARALDVLVEDGFSTTPR